MVQNEETKMDKDDTRKKEYQDLQSSESKIREENSVITFLEEYRMATLQVKSANDYHFAVFPQFMPTTHHLC